MRKIIFWGLLVVGVNSLYSMLQEEPNDRELLSYEEIEQPILVKPESSPKKGRSCINMQLLLDKIDKFFYYNSYNTTNPYSTLRK